VHVAAQSEEKIWHPADAEETQRWMNRETIARNNTLHLASIYFPTQIPGNLADNRRKMTRRLAISEIVISFYHSEFSSFLSSFPKFPWWRSRKLWREIWSQRVAPPPKSERYSKAGNSNSKSNCSFRELNYSLKINLKFFLYSLNCSSSW